MATIAEALELAVKHHQAGDLSYAEEIYRRVLQADPNNADAWCYLATACLGANRLEEAEAHYRQAIALNPRNASARSDLGIALAQMGRRDEAVASFHEALRLKPDHAEAHNNLAIVLAQLGNPEEALAAHRQALRLRPDYPECYYNMNLVFKEQRKLDEAVDCLERALAQKPDYVDAHWDRAVIWLLGGDFERGWREYEWRWHKPEMTRRSFRQPLWDGSPVAGRTLLVHAEQGLGDTLQFIRYLPRLKQLAGTVIVECQKILVRLVSGCPGIDRVVVQGEALPSFDLQVPLLSLPGTLKTTLDAIPADVPYLFAEESLAVRWRREIAPVQALKVGIVWQGRPTNRDDFRRSVPLARFLPLGELDGVRLFSLQKGPGPQQQQEVAAAPSVIDLGSRFDSFADTAAALSNLDLVITVDTVVAHCAGGLGIPTWLVLPFIPEWRWLLDREDSPWYPGMRLFRQSRAGCWDDVFERMECELRMRNCRWQR